MSNKTIAIAMTGASGAGYTLRLVECLIRGGHNVWLMISTPAQIVVSMETDLALPGRAAEQQKFFTQHFNAAEGQLRVFGKEEWTAPVASGSGAPDAMVVCPCTMGMLSAVATGASNNLMERAADVMLKERHQLIIVPRETPVSAIHLENMLRITQAGGIILPANPGYYHNPESIQDVIDFVVARILDQLGVDQSLLPRWGSESGG